MAVEVKVPSVGESITEGTIARWFKPSGSVVKANEPLFELETDKATTEVAAPAAGVLTIDVPEGKQVAVGSVIGHIEVGAASPTPSAAPRPAPAAAAPDSTARDNNAPAPTPPRTPAAPGGPRGFAVG